MCSNRLSPGHSPLTHVLMLLHRLQILSHRTKDPPLRQADMSASALPDTSDFTDPVNSAGGISTALHSIIHAKFYKLSRNQEQ